MLDSKLTNFFKDCQVKIDNLTKEVNSLKNENSELEKIVSENERENKNIKFKKDKIQMNFNHISNLDKDLQNQVKKLKEQITKAHNDLCSITKAHQQQRVSINNSESQLQESINNIEEYKRIRVSNFISTSKMLDDKIDELKSLISSKDRLNASNRLELLEKDLKDSYRVSSIMDLNRRLTTKSSN